MSFKKEIENIDEVRSTKSLRLKQNEISNIECCMERIGVVGERRIQAEAVP